MCAAMACTECGVLYRRHGALRNHMIVKRRPRRQGSTDDRPLAIDAHGRTPRSVVSLARDDRAAVAQEACAGAE